MPKYIKTNSTSKKGVNFVRGIVEAQNSIFNEIPGQNDVGIDGFIEIIKDENTTGKMVAVQIKAGSSYFENEKRLCKIPVGSHFDYWSKHPLPVVGIVYLPDEKIGFWIDIKEYLVAKGKCSAIQYEANDINRFNEEDFENIFIPVFLQEPPTLSFDRTIRLLNSKNYDEVELGAAVAFWRFGDKNLVWERFIDILITKEIGDIPHSVLHYFGFVVDWADIWLGRQKVTQENKNFVQGYFANIKIDTIIKLLNFINEDNPIARGTLGHFAERIISNVPDVMTKLKKIIEEDKLEAEIRATALWIYASHSSREAKKLIKELKHTTSDFIGELQKVEDYLKKYKAVSFYS
jgi:hypothetical protein